MSFPSGLVVDAPALVGSIGGAFTPSSVGTLALWLDASQITGLADAAAVSSWSDLSGNGKHAVQATAAAKPTYKTAIQNGRPVVRFDGTSDGLQTPALTLGATTGITLYWAGNVPAATAATQLLAETAVGAGNFQIYMSATPSLTFGQQGNIGLTNWVINAASGLTGPVVWCGVFNTTLPAATESQGYKNGTLVGALGTNNDNSSAFADKTFDIGARANATSLWCACDIYEILVYSSALSGANRAKVDRYLRSKWATP